MAVLPRVPAPPWRLLTMLLAFLLELARSEQREPGPGADGLTRGPGHGLAPGRLARLPARAFPAAEPQLSLGLLVTAGVALTW